MFTSRAAATITAGKKGALVVSLRRGWFHPLGVCNANNKKKKKIGTIGQDDLRDRCSCVTKEKSRTKIEDDRGKGFKDLGFKSV